MNNKFRLRLCSDLDYEKMVVDICYENETVAKIICENGPKSMQIEIYSSENGTLSWNFFLEDFLVALEAAKSHLIEI